MSDLPPGAPSVPELRRLVHLAAAVPVRQVIVLPVDPGAELALLAAGAGPAPVVAATGPNPTAALQRLRSSRHRLRIELVAGEAIPAAAGWSRPIGLLVLPGRTPALRALLAAWARFVEAEGHVLFVGGSAPAPAALGLPPAHWTAHVHAQRTFLVTRRPFG